jgi:hypothetical protein
MGVHKHIAPGKTSIAHVRFESKADIAREQLNVRFAPESGHGSVGLLCPLYAKSRPLRLTGEAEFGLHVHWWGQCRTWPCYPVLFDLLEKPSMKTACQHPFDPITAPENSLLLYVSVFHGDHIISSTSQVSRANR